VFAVITNDRARNVRTTCDDALRTWLPRAAGARVLGRVALHRYHMNARDDPMAVKMS
jgi:hypothetical protein